MTTKKEEPKTVGQMIYNYIKKNGGVGLCSDCCGCGLDDLMPCNGDYGFISNCEIATKKEWDEDKGCEVFSN